jgi:hypothetical protein
MHIVSSSASDRLRLEEVDRDSSDPCITCGLLKNRGQIFQEQFALIARMCQPETLEIATFAAANVYQHRASHVVIDDHSSLVDRSPRDARSAVRSHETVENGSFRAVLLVIFEDGISAALVTLEQTVARVAPSLIRRSL